jgi:hypothetical protein
MDKLGMTALHLAAVKGHAHVVEQILRIGADVNVVADYGLTALYLAVMCGRNTVVEQLLQAPGINVNATDSDGKTALAFAVQEHREEIAAMLRDLTIIKSIRAEFALYRIRDAEIEGRESQQAIQEFENMYGKVDDLIHEFQERFGLRIHLLSYLLRTKEFKIIYKRHLLDVKNDLSIANSEKAERIGFLLSKILMLYQEGIFLQPPEDVASSSNQ